MNLRKLYEHLDGDSRRVLHEAADAAARDGRRSITIEFFLLLLLRDRQVGADLMRSLDSVGADAPAIESALAGSVANEPRSASGGLPAFDESLAHLLREAWALSFDDYGEASVAPLRFFETVARRGEAWPALVAMLPGFDRINLGELASAATAPTETAAGPAAAGTDRRYPELSGTATTWPRRPARTTSTRWSVSRRSCRPSRRSCCAGARTRSRSSARRASASRRAPAAS